MNRKYTLTRLAERDIERIWSYIQQDNPSAARKMVNKIYEAFALISEHPHIGHTREDLTLKPVLFWTLNHRYYIIYRLKETVQVLRVLPTEKNLKTIL